MSEFANSGAASLMDIEFGEISKKSAVSLNSETALFWLLPSPEQGKEA